MNLDFISLYSDHLHLYNDIKHSKLGNVITVKK